MTKTFCDWCKNTADTAGHVHVKGIQRDFARGITLPESAMNLDFCGPVCFWEWAQDQIEKQTK